MTLSKTLFFIAITLMSFCFSVTNTQEAYVLSNSESSQKISPNIAYSNDNDIDNQPTLSFLIKKIKQNWKSLVIGSVISSVIIFQWFIIFNLYKEMKMWRAVAHS